MRLTIEDNTETIKRYRHMRPALPWGPPRCSAKCPGSRRTCTLGRGHSGPHVAHVRFGRVVAVWDGSTSVRDAKRSEGQKPVAAVSRTSWAKGLASAYGAYRGRLVRGSRSIEEGFLVIFVLSIVGFIVAAFLKALAGG